MFQVLAPPADLRPYIRFFWAAKSASGAAPERIVPDGCCELILHFGERPHRLGEANAARQPEAFVFGQIERAIQLETQGGLDVLGVRFTPAGVAALWSIDVSALGGRECALEDLFPVRGRLCVAQLRDVAKLEPRALSDSSLELKARSEVVGGWLRATARSARRPYIQRSLAALQHMERVDADAASAARAANVSRRGLERAFRSTVGLSPGAYLRLRRVEACARALRANRASLAAIAVEAGYADQAHFSREFRAIVGAAPAAYRRELGGSSARLQD